VNYGDTRIPERIWDKIVPCACSGCWFWTATIAGVPQVRWKVGTMWKVVGVRKVFHQVLTGITATDLLELGIGIGACMNECVNPAHYVFGTHKELGYKNNRQRRFCVNGHDMEIEGVYKSNREGPNHRTGDHCRACRAARCLADRERVRKKRLARMTPERLRRFLRKSKTMKSRWQTGELRRRDGSLTPLATRAA
jgi:hypothetical protein